MLARALAAKDEDVKRLQKESRPLRAELERTQVRLYSGHERDSGICFAPSLSK
jgi:hypothetical protein